MPYYTPIIIIDNKENYHNAWKLTDKNNIFYIRRDMIDNFVPRGAKPYRRIDGKIIWQVDKIRMNQSIDLQESIIYRGKNVTPNNSWYIEKNIFFEDSNY